MFKNCTAGANLDGGRGANLGPGSGSNNFSVTVSTGSCCRFLSSTFLVGLPPSRTVTTLTLGCNNSL